MNAKNLPNEKGIYFARSRQSMGWYDLIVEVSGDAPWLSVFGAYSRMDRKVYTGDVDAWFFGPKINIPEVPNGEINTR